MEKISVKRRLIGGALILAGGISLAACSSSNPNFEGRGNSYHVRGPINDVEEDGTIHINEKKLIVEATQGRASSWFKNNDGHNAFSDNFNFEPLYHHKEDGFWGQCAGDVFVGQVYDQNNQVIKPQQLLPGEIVEIEGSIRDSNVWKQAGKTGYCGIEEYSVFDTVRVVG